MPVFTVLRRVDAYVNYIAEVEAEDAQDAVDLAQEDEGQYVWKDLGPSEFDARGFVALDAEGNEIESTWTGCS